MTDVGREQEKKRLGMLRQFQEALTEYQWEFAADDLGTHVVAVRRGGEAERIATIHSCASPDELEVLCRALDTLRFGLGLIDRATARIRELMPQDKPAEKPKRRANLGWTAKNLCGQPLFRRFLEHKLPGKPMPDEPAADEGLKFLLSIESKGEIDRRPEVKAAFEQLNNEFYLWKRGDL